RSRGELPLVLAREPTAAKAVAAFSESVEPTQYNPAWLLVGDRRTLVYIELDGIGQPTFRQLSAGVHILENCPLDASSAKVDRARELLGDPSTLTGDR